MNFIRYMLAYRKSRRLDSLVAKSLESYFAGRRDAEREIAGTVNLSDREFEERYTNA